MTISGCPCRGCKSRWVTDSSRCHSTCKAYIEWKKKSDYVHDQSMYDELTEYIVNEITKRRKK